MFKKIKVGIAKTLTKTIIRNFKNDINYAKGEGAEKRANRIYLKIKMFAYRTWNKFIDKIIDKLLDSMEKDIREIFEYCKRTGENPYDYFPDELKEILGEDYFSDFSFAM